MTIDVAQLVSNLNGLVAKRWPRKVHPEVDIDMTTELGDSVCLMACVGDVPVSFSEPFELQHIQPKVQDPDPRKTWLDPDPIQRILEMYIGAINDELSCLHFALNLAEVDYLTRQLGQQSLQNIRELSQVTVALRLECPAGVYNSYSSEGVCLTDLGLTTSQIRELWRDSQAGHKTEFRQWT